MGTVVKRSRRRHGRQFRRAGLRALRLVRRHHFTMVSACVLAVALLIALGVSAPSLDGDEAPAVAAQNPTARAPTSRSPTASARPAPTATPASRLLVYYVVSDEKQRYEMERAVQADAAYIQRQAPAGPQVYRYYLVVRNPRDEAEAVTLLNELFEVAPSQGYRLRVLDLR